MSKNKITNSEEFIARAKELNGDRYDYSKVNYVNCSTKVCITCKKHGDFWTNPNNFIYRKTECPECAKEKQITRQSMTTKEFIEKAKKIHGDRYDYSKVNYVNSKTKICIICQKHGEFWQTPSHHLQGCNCPKCANEEIHNKQRHKKDEFIEKAKQVHGDKYDYSNVEYVNSKIPVKIFCKKHEKYFFQAPYNHVSGQGCPQCAIEKNVSKSKIGTDNFIKRAQNIHGDKYDYSKVNYINRNTKVNIHCNICGKDFEQTPAIHLSGHGCPYCANEKTRQRLLLTKEEFIKKAKKIHGDRYDYSNVEYNGVHKQIFIHCNKCGNDFWQDANSHLHGVGCPICQSSHLEEEMRLLLKENHIEFEEQKRFDWLGKQSLDFYIPSKSIAIECQGEQHYQSVKIFGGFQKFVRQKTLDIQKRKLCTENHVKIIYFTHFTKAIDNQSTFDSKEKILKKIY